jgi:hypothetical protein
VSKGRWDQHASSEFLKMGDYILHTSRYSPVPKRLYPLPMTYRHSNPTPNPNP